MFIPLSEDVVIIIRTGKCNIACFVVKLIKTICNSLVLCLPTKMWTKKDLTGKFLSSALKIRTYLTTCEQICIPSHLCLNFVQNNSPIHFVFDHVFNSSRLTLSINMIVNIIKVYNSVEIKVYKIHIPYTLWSDYKDNYSEKVQTPNKLFCINSEFT